MIEVFVDGRAAPKGSRIQGRTKSGHSFTRPASKYEKPWTEAVKAQVQIAARHQRLEPPYALEMEFLIHAPRQKRYDWPTSADLDKLERAVIDGAVQGGAMVDDRHVTALTSTKRFAQKGERPGVYLRISEDRKLQDRPVAA